MNRLLVVSRNAALAVALTSAEYHVVVLSPDKPETWQGELARVDAAVLELDSAAAATAVLNGLRKDGVTVPVVVATGGGAAWAKVRSLQLPGVGFLHLPLAKPALLEAVHDALSGSHVPAKASAPSTAPTAPAAKKAPSRRPAKVGDMLTAAREKRGLSVRDVARRTLILEETVQQIENGDFSGCGDTFLARGHVRSIAVTLGLDPERVVARFDAMFGPASAAAAKPGRRRPDKAAAPAAPAPASSPIPQPRALPIAAEGPPPPPAAQARQPAESYAPRLPARGEQGPAAELQQLLLRLLSHSAELVGVEETADAVLAESIERAGADAGCVLLPDNGVWQLCASSGLRDNEHRLRLPEDHWLVREVVHQGQGFLVMDSDIMRSRLANAPLAAWPHLMGVPVSGVGGLILLARDKVAFVERDLEAVAGVAVEAVPLLTTALLVRQLSLALPERAR
jgi:transcriptional regulator with XRE-family HTH domain